MSPSPSAAEKLYLIVGYDGSAPAVRALDAATRLMRGRDGEIAVVYVAHLTSLEMMSADAIVEVEESFDELARELQAQVSAQLAGVEERWRFERRQGPIAETLVAARPPDGRVGRHQPGQAHASRPHHRAVTGKPCPGALTGKHREAPTGRTAVPCDRQGTAARALPVTFCHAAGRRSAPWSV
jgi:hypothetical protein